MAKYTLPELSFNYSALEPHVSARIMELHHSKHHAAYVAGANKALEQLEEVRAKGDFASLPALERALAFNVSGHVLHSLFWTNLGPGGGARPQGALAAALERDFGSFDAFKNQLTAAAASTMGSGWAALGWEPLGRRLLVTQIYDHQSNVAQGSQLIMVLDAWEHAYYLQYENRKTDFFAAIWNCWAWPAIGKRYELVAAY
jgi:Fe-Mn family superoxide dismutase